MSKKALPRRELLLELLDYNKDTGELTWKRRSADRFSTEHHAATWNTRYSLLEAGYRSKKDGYIYVEIYKETFLSHRLIWLMVTGEEPDEIDHINGKRNDNRFHNLRNTTHAENCRNSSCANNNTSGHTGVYRVERLGVWAAQIKVNQETIPLGTFIQLSEAIRVRKEAEKKYNFHPNHGKQT